VPAMMKVGRGEVRSSNSPPSTYDSPAAIPMAPLRLPKTWPSIAGGTRRWISVLVATSIALMLTPRMVCMTKAVATAQARPLSRWPALLTPKPSKSRRTVETNLATLAALVYEGRPLAEALRSGDLEIGGDGSAVERFLTLFPLPEPTAPAAVGA
jgi:hypothetical protein